MNGGGKEYALALFSIMTDSKDEDTGIYTDLMYLGNVFKDEPGFIEFLGNPSIPKSERKALIRDIFESEICEPVFAFLNVMLEHGDLSLLLSAVDEFRSMFEAYMNMADAVITSAVELTDDEKNRLVMKLNEVTGKYVRPVYVIDKSLIGGVSVRVDGRDYDGSVRKNLKNLKEVMA